MNNLQNDWLAHQLHQMRYEELLRVAAQERLAQEARSGKNGEDEPAVQFVAGLVGKMLHRQRNPQPKPDASLITQCCAVSGSGV